MLKSKFTKVFKILLFLILPFIIFNKAYAFFSPNTLHLLSASVGSGIWQAIVFLLATIISLGIKIKDRNIKRTGLIILFLGLIVCSISGGLHFYKLKKLNQFFLLSDSEFIDIYDYIDMPTDKFINLSKIDQSEYESFKKISLVKGQNIRLIDTANTISLFRLKEIMTAKGIEKYLEEHDITKEDKILVYCNFGWSSSLVAYFLDELDYDIYYTKLNGLENKDYIEFDRFPLTGTQIPIITNFKREKIDKYYIIFMFHKVEDEYCNPEIYPQDIKNLLRKIVIWPEITSKNEQCNIPEIEFDKIFMEHSKIVCLNKLDCILTQHYIDYLGLSEQFPEIFFIEN